MSTAIYQSRNVTKTKKGAEKNFTDMMIKVTVKGSTKKLTGHYRNKKGSENTCFPVCYPAYDKIDYRN
jgi:hypothetical protein